MNNLNIIWDNKTFLKYTINGKEHIYKPDFHLKISNIFIEVKGYYPEQDKMKMYAVLKSNPDIQIYMLHQNYEEFIKHQKLLFEASTLLTKDKGTIYLTSERVNKRKRILKYEN